jgi:ElaB/YqjD/DUF883 family membrane-anchored ribosome-binding protein
MPDIIKPMKEASQDFAAELADLRDEITKLTASITDIARKQASAATSTVWDTVEGARQKFADGAAGAQHQLRGMGSDIEATIERNPLAAVLTALSAGLLIGMMSASRK